MKSTIRWCEAHVHPRDRIVPGTKVLAPNTPLRCERLGCEDRAVVSVPVERHTT